MADRFEFPLAWRWTSPGHAEFSDAELALLNPLPPDEAARVHEAGLRALSGELPDPRQFARIESGSADVAVETGRDWLRARRPDLDERVCVSWDRATALRTTWRLFTERWDDFCYPASDDVTVTPDDGPWMLLFHHWEAFSFAVKG